MSTNQNQTFRIEFSDETVLDVSAYRADYDRDWVSFSDVDGAIVATVSARRIKHVTRVATSVTVTAEVHESTAK